MYGLLGNLFVLALSPSSETQGFRGNEDALSLASFRDSLHRADEFQ